jgi:hypothetical protein
MRKRKGEEENTKGIKKKESQKYIKNEGGEKKQIAREEKEGKMNDESKDEGIRSSLPIRLITGKKEIYI